MRMLFFALLVRFHVVASLPPALKHLKLASKPAIANPNSYPYLDQHVLERVMLAADPITKASMAVTNRHLAEYYRSLHSPHDDMQQATDILAGIVDTCEDAFHLRLPSYKVRFRGRQLDFDEYVMVTFLTNLMKDRQSPRPQVYATLLDILSSGTRFTWSWLWRRSISALLSIYNPTVTQGIALHLARFQPPQESWLYDLSRAQNYSSVIKVLARTLKQSSEYETLPSMSAIFRLHNEILQAPQVNWLAVLELDSILIFLSSRTARNAISALFNLY